MPLVREGIVLGYWVVGYYREPSEDGDRVLDWLKGLVQYVVMNRMFRVKRLDDQPIIAEFSYKKDKCQLDLSEGPKQGKLWDQMNTLIKSLKLSGVSVSVSKIYQNQTLVNINLSEQRYNGQHQLDSEMLNLLHEQIVVSHQKLLTQVCQANGSNYKRTIRPLRTQQLYSTQLFMPQLPTTQKQQLIEVMKEKFQLQGWVATDNHKLISKIAKLMMGRRASDQSLLVIQELGVYRGQKYVILLESHLENDLSLSHQTLIAIQHKFKAVLHKSQLDLPNLDSKKIVIMEMINILQKGLTKRVIIDQFRTSSLVYTLKINKFMNLVCEIMIPQKTRQNRYFSMLQTGMDKLKINNRSIKHSYTCLALSLTPLLHKYHLRWSHEVAFKSIYSSINYPSAFGTIRGINKINNILERLVSRKKSITMKLITTYSGFKTINHKSKTTLAAQQLSNLLTRIVTRNMEHFFIQKTILSHCFQSNIALIAQEFGKLNFYKKQQFVRFANERFQAVLRHLEFGLVKKVEIAICQRVKGRKLVFRVDQEYVEEVYEVQESHKAIQVPTPSRYSVNHSLLFRLHTKNGLKGQQELNSIKRVIEQGLVPCYTRYLDKTLSKTIKLMELLTSITCKQTWNGSCSQPQKIYAFGDKCTEHQSSKLKFLSIMKSLGRAQSIAETKLIADAINSESKALYGLEYECNAIGGLLSGMYCKNQMSQQEGKMMGKYKEVVTRGQLTKAREELEVLEQEEQGKTLKYQIKSKTFATSKVITFLERRDYACVEGVSGDYLMGIDKENQSTRGNGGQIERAFVERKLQLGDMRDQVLKQKQNQKKKGSRLMWLVLGQLKRSVQKREARQMLGTLLLPRKSSMRA